MQRERPTHGPEHFIKLRNRSIGVIVSTLGGIALGVLGKNQIPPYAMWEITNALSTGIQWTSEFRQAIASGQITPSLDMARLIIQAPGCWTAGLIGGGLLTLTRRINKIKRGKKN